MRYYLSALLLSGLLLFSGCQNGGGSICDPNPCTAPNQTQCVVKDDNARCDCDAGYHLEGQSCVKDSVCKPNPCAETNRTLCVDENGTKRCDCEVGYVEHEGNCVARSDPCTPNPCQETGRSQCKIIGERHSCECDAGLTLIDGACIVDPCALNPCTELNKTQCTPLGLKSYSCNCDPGFFPDRQQGCSSQDPCSPNPCNVPKMTRCLSSGSSYTCECDEGHSLDPDTFSCTAGNPCEPNPCTETNKTLCLKSGESFNCLCDVDYVPSGDSCVKADPCDPNPCADDRVCVKLDPGFECRCKEGFVMIGDQCVATDPCKPNPCTEWPKSRCIALDASSYQCFCEQGMLSDGEGCKPVDSCGTLYVGLVDKTDASLKSALFDLTGKDVTVMEYDAARLQMFWNLDYVDGKVRGVYGGAWVPVTIGVQPNYTKELNAEHTWPQSMGAVGDAKSDLHHLFPTNPSINSSRGNLPFGPVELADRCYDSTGITLCHLVTDTWFSKRGTTLAGLKVFEPARQHRGDVARAMFYFSIRYQIEIDAGQEAAFRLWHYSDPVSTNELNRNAGIEQLQKNRNPFVDCPHLVYRITDF